MIRDLLGSKIAGRTCLVVTQTRMEVRLKKHVELISRSPWRVAESFYRTKKSDSAQTLLPFEVCNIARIFYKDSLSIFPQISWNLQKSLFLPQRNLEWKFCEPLLVLLCHFHTKNFLIVSIFEPMSSKFHWKTSRNCQFSVQIFCFSLMRDWCKFQHEWANIDKLVKICVN